MSISLRFINPRDPKNVKIQIGLSPSLSPCLSPQALEDHYFTLSSCWICFHVSPTSQSLWPITENTWMSHAKPTLGCAITKFKFFLCLSVYLLFFVCLCLIIWPLISLSLSQSVCPFLSQRVSACLFLSL